jgi:L-aspartate oxidase
MEHIQFQPLTLFERDKPCYPLPVSLLEEGGKILNPLKAPIENICLNDLAPQLYREMIRSRAEHLWLDLTLLDSVVLKEKFPIVDVGCLSRGFNFAKDLLPIVPAAHSTCGGIAVDKVGQTSLHRLRALGEVSCTGLFYNFKAEEISVLESLTWSVACAEDIAKQIGKFVYYFPDVKEWNHSFETGQDNLIEEDWLLLKQIMWYYVGIERNKRHLKRGYALLQELKEQNERDASSFSMSKTRFLNALQTCLLIAKSSLQKSEEKEAVLSIQPAYSLN